MSSITPPEGYNSYYTKHFSELEDDLKKDFQRAQARLREREDELEKDYSTAIRAREEKTGEAVEGIRNEASESAMRSRENARAEIERMRKSTYDRNGRNLANENEALKERIANVSTNSAVREEADKKRIQDAERGHQKHVEDLNKDYADRMDKALQGQRDSAQEASAKALREGKNAAEIQREESAKRVEALSQARMEDQQAMRRDSERVIADSKRDLDNLRSHQDSAAEHRLSKSSRESSIRMEREAKKLEEAATEQTRKLRDQIDDLVTAESSYVKDKAQGRTDAIREYDDDWRTREEVMQSAHERELSKFREVAELADKHNAHLNERNLHEKDTYFTQLLKRTASENAESRKDLETRYDKSHNEMVDTMKKDKVRSQTLLETSLHDAHEQRRDALENQARSYQNTIEATRAMDNDKITALEKEIQRKSGSQDTSEISPGAENAVRRSVAREYEKNFTAETDRNKRAVGALQRSYSDRMQNQESEHATQQALREKTFQTDRHQDQARFMEHVQDTEHQKEEALRSKDGEHERQTETMNRAFSQMNTRLRNEYESMLQNMRDDAATKISAIRQDSEFQAKTAQRAFSTKQNELIREYEKKLADQKTDFEARTEELKSQVQQAHRDSERRMKVAVEDQARGYEQRLSQLQAQSQERERSLSQNFEDQLEKVKRANALLQSKKG